MVVLTVTGFIINTAFLFVITRRLMGVPVGWVRTLLVAVALTGGINGLLTLVGQQLGLVTDNGQLATGTDPLVAGAVLTLVIAWGVALGVGVLVLLEALVPTGTVPSPMAVLRDLPARRRRARRYGQIVRIAVRHGLGGFLRAGSRLPDEADQAWLGRRLRLAFSDAGVTFVKLGQMLATRPDLVGVDLARELGQLQADNPPQDWTLVEQTLREELGESWRSEFASFEQVPLAAASVGQVHTAVLTDGSPVVVKVQRASAQAQVRADLDILLRMTRWLQRTTGWGQALGVHSLAKGFAASLQEELDYRVEAANAAGVAAGVAAGTETESGNREGATGDGVGLVRVPATYPNLSSGRVLVMEKVDGTPLSRAGVVDGLDGPLREKLAQALLSSVLTQVLRTGVFHADLHAGNVLVERAEGAGEGVGLVLLDFGSVGRLDRSAREAVGRLLFAVDRGDSVGAVDALCDVLDPPDDLDDRTLERELGALISRVQRGAGVGSVTVFGDLFALVLRHGFTVPPQVAAAFRALGALEGTLQVLHPDLDLITAARSAGQEQLSHQLGPAQVRASLEEHLVHVVPILQRLPRRLDAIAASVQSGQAQVRVRWLADPGDRAFLTGLVHHVVITVLAAVLSVCGVLLLVADSGPELSPSLGLNQVLGGTLFLFAFVLAARALALVFRGNRP